MNVSVVGLGKLGSCLMAVLASRHDVVGVDLNAKIVHDLNEGVAPFIEPGLQDLLVENREHYRATTDTFEVVGTQVTFVVVPTPSEEGGGFSNEFIFQAMDMIGAALELKPGAHIVVIVSTVMPGATIGPIRERLERAANRSDIALAYSPEFIALGSVIHDLQHPDMLLVGAEDSWVQATVIRCLDPEDLVPVSRMNTMEAEIAKIAVNAYITTKISFANTLGEICDRINGTSKLKDYVNVDHITSALGLDTRIGPKYLKAATGFGGPCFPRDNAAFIAFAGSAPISEATIEVNDRQVERVVGLIKNAGDSFGVSVLGLSYKPNTPVADCSFGVDLANSLQGAGYSVTAYDPLAMDNARPLVHPGVKFAATAQDAVNANRTVVLVQPWTEFKDLKYGSRKVVDLWGLL